MLSCLEYMYHDLGLVKEFNMNPITLKRWLVTPGRQRRARNRSFARRLNLSTSSPTAGDSGELPEQPLSQLPPLFLRQSDDVRHDPPLQPAGRHQVHAYRVPPMLFIPDPQVNPSDRDQDRPPLD